MSDLDRIRAVYPDAYVVFDRTASDCGYLRPWFVWSTQDDDMRCLGEGKTEQDEKTCALNAADAALEE